jgi:hypothetical protein
MSNLWRRFPSGRLSAVDLALSPIAQEFWEVPGLNYITFSGTIAATTTLSSEIRVSQRLTGTITGVSVSSGTIRELRRISGSCIAGTTNTGDIHSDWYVHGAAVAITTCPVPLFRELRRISGSASAYATGSGTIQTETEFTLAGTVIALAHGSGAIRAIWYLHGTTASVTAGTGIIRNNWFIRGSAMAAASISPLALGRFRGLQGNAVAVTTAPGRITKEISFAGAAGVFPSLETYGIRFFMPEYYTGTETSETFGGNSPISPGYQSKSEILIGLSYISTIMPVFSEISTIKTQVNLSEV